MTRHTAETDGAARGGDVAARFLATLDGSVKETPVTPEEARKVLWKIDLTILPLLWISALVASTDKLILSNAAIYGMKADTHLVGDQYAWVGRCVVHAAPNGSLLISFNTASSLLDTCCLNTRLRCLSSAFPWPNFSRPQSSHGAF